MEYNKERDTRDKSRPLKSGSGPRDLQQRQKLEQNSYVVRELKDQIELLTRQLTTTSTTGNTAAIYTAEEFDTELNKVILQVSAEMENKHSVRIKEQQEEILRLRRQLEEGKTDAISNKEIKVLVDKAVEETKSEYQAQLFLLQETAAKLNKELRLAEDKVIELKKQINLYEPKILEVEQLRHTLEITKSQLTSLKNNPHNSSGDSDKLNATITDLKNELAQIKTDLAVANSKLESKDEIIKIKDDTINTLKSTPVNIQITDSQTTKSVVSESSRPKMEQVFIDPSDTKNSMAPHLNFKDVKIAQQEKMSSKVAKLKDLLGSLPE